MIPNWVNEYIGIQFDAQAFNCWTLVRKVYAEQLGVILPDWTHPQRESSTRYIREVAERMAESRDRDWHKRPSPTLGDVAHFSVEGLPFHVGIYIGGPKRYMLHVIKDADSCLESLNALAWQRRLIGFYQWNK